MLRSLALSLLLSLAAAPLFAAKHTWLGTSSNLVSDDRNWSGGSPAGDPDAELELPPEAVSKYVYNDVPNLRFKALLIRHQDYTVYGAPMQTTDGIISASSDDAILCDLAIEGKVTVYGGYGFKGLVFAGVISGSGGIEFLSDLVRFTGAQSNTYTGETVMRGTSLHLQKENGAIAVPGDVRMVQSSFTSRLYIDAPEQIADSATLTTTRGEVYVNADETVHVVKLTYNVNGDGTLTADSFEIADRPEVRANLRLKQPELVVNANNWLTADGSVILPAGGITLRGPGRVAWTSTSNEPTRVDGPSASLKNPNGSVELISGELHGQAASVTARGGTINYLLTSTTDLRLGPAVTVRTFASGYSNPSFVLNGTLDLAGAMLDLIPPSSFEAQPVVIINNKSSQPVIGTFAGIAEGGIALNRWRVSYRGGDGNDVTVTELQKPNPSIAVSQTPKPAFVGEPVTFTATVSSASGTPTGNVMFELGDESTTVPIVDGKATLQKTFIDDTIFSVSVRYLGDAVFGSSDTTYPSIDVTYRKPVIDSITPSEVEGGAKVPVVIRGSNFAAGSHVSGGGYDQESQVVSPTEIHATIDLTTVRTATTFNIFVVTPGSHSVGSDPKPIAVREVSQSPIRFDDTGITATVTPGARTVWVTSDQNLNRVTNVLSDDDGDGTVRWPWLRPPNYVYAFVDLATGEPVVRGRGTTVPNVRPFPAHTFLRDTSGKRSQFILALPGTDLTSYSTWNVLWVRPGVGAWRRLFIDGQDADQTRNSLLFGSVVMSPLGSAPAHPEEFAAGDTILAIPLGAHYDADVFAERLDASIEASSPGVLNTLEQSWSFSEDDGTAKLTVIRTGGADGSVSVRYRTTDRTALGGVQYVPTEGTLTFAPGELLKNIEIPLIDDAIFRRGGTFHVALFDPIGTTLGENTEFLVGIDDDEARPLVELVGPELREVVEGDGPTLVPIQLRVTGPPSTRPMIVRWHTLDTNYPASGIINFTNTDRLKTIFVSIPGNDVQDFNDRQMAVDFLYDDGNDLSMDFRFVRFIIHDDDSPRVDVSDVVVIENGVGAHITLTAVPAPKPQQTFTVSYTTLDGSAKAGSDYVVRQGTVTFLPGQSQQAIDVAITNDGEQEGDESFTVAFTSNSLWRPRAKATIVILDDETSARPRMSIASKTVAETNDPTSVSLEVRLSAATSATVKAHYSTADGTATAGADYQSLDDVLTFAPGETAKTIVVPLFGDILDEADETFTITLSAPENAAPDAARAEVTIIDDDAATPFRRRTTRP